MPEQAGLQAVPRAGDLVAPADRLDQRRDGLVAGFVGEVAGRQPVGVAAQAVVDRLVGQQRVEHVGPRAQPRRERRGHGPGGGAALLAVGAHQPAERDVEGHGLAAGGSGRATWIAAVSSSNSRVQAPAPVSDFSVSTFSSGSLSRCSR